MVNSAMLRLNSLTVGSCGIMLRFSEVKSILDFKTKNK